jgi:hypothetical protein
MDACYRYTTGYRAAELPQSANGRQTLQINVWLQYHDNTAPAASHVLYKIAESQYPQWFQGRYQFGSPGNLLLV